MSRAAVIVMPRGVGAWTSAEALWITARGWARAGEERFGSAWIVTPDGAWSADELPRTGGVAGTAGTASGGGRRRLPLPATLRTWAKDLLLWRRQSRFEVPVDGPWAGTGVALVWEHHDLFNRAGERLAAATGAPLVRYVHAPQVWEARKWGVERPLWGRWLERHEVHLLRRADLVACVSDGVRARLVELGLEADRVVVVPMAVDADEFTPQGPSARRELGIDDAAVVVGWCGSFRRFHGLDRVVLAFAAAAARVPRLHLLLVGDGPTRGEVETVARECGVSDRVTFAGRIDHRRMPAHLRAMDLAVVSSDARGGFHYSPLKLREYAACGLPVVAPDEGELAGLADAGFVHLHPPGDTQRLAAVLEALAVDDAGRRREAVAARRHTLAHWTWRAQLDYVMERVR